VAVSQYNDPCGPIEHFSWGRFVVEGVEHASTDQGPIGAGKDIRIVGSQVSPWRERHGHKLMPEMVAGVYDQGVQVLVVGNGVHGLIKVSKTARKAIAAHGIAHLVVQRTPEACRTYNALSREGLRVALLAHGTC